MPSPLPAPARRPSANAEPRPARPVMRLEPSGPAAAAAPPSLLARVGAGDPTAVRECVAEFGGLVATLARRWSPDPMEAEDAMQEIFFDLWKSAARYDPAKASERGFVAMLARRRLIDRGRRRQRELPVEPMPEGFDAPAPGGDAVAALAGRLDADAVLAQLTPMQRTLISRNLLDGQTHDEIARETQLPLGTVKSHIRRGLLKARALLAGRPAADDEEEA